jgi:hypothetical protein
MDENKRIFRVIEKPAEMLDNTTEEQVKSGISHQTQTNPIYKNLAKFHNEKIGDKWSIRDLLR